MRRSWSIVLCCLVMVAPLSAKAPDLVVSKLSYQGTAAPGAIINLQAVVENQGSAEADTEKGLIGFRVLVVQGEKERLLWRDSLKALGPGAMVPCGGECNLPHRLDTSVPAKLVARVDYPYERIEEANERNNERSIPLKFKASKLPDLEVSADSLRSDLKDDGRCEVRARARLSNRGAAIERTFGLEGTLFRRVIGEEGKERRTRVVQDLLRVDGMKAGETRVFEFDFTVEGDESDQWAIKVRADDGKHVKESREDNNVAEYPSGDDEGDGDGD